MACAIAAPKKFGELSPSGFCHVQVLEMICQGLHEKLDILQGTDASFASKLRSMLREHSCFGCQPGKTEGSDFFVEHFAGRVPYKCTNILDKNRDSLNSGVKD